MYTKTNFEGVWIFEPRLFEDHRGYFFESFNLNNFEKHTGLRPTFVQDNQSGSTKGVMRGLHFQKSPYGQSKLVRVIVGEVQDVIVDLRKESATYGKSLSINLSGENKKQLFVPKGFAHGFLVLSDYAEFFYKCDAFYEPKADTGMYFDDPKIGIEWQIDLDKMVLSDKDKNLPLFDEVEY